MEKIGVVRVRKSFDIKRTFIPSWRVEFRTNILADIGFWFHFTSSHSSDLGLLNVLIIIENMCVACDDKLDS